MYSLVSTKLNLSLSKIITFSSLSYFTISRHGVGFGHTNTVSSITRNVCELHSNSIGR
jgi:hypothetical protein